MKPMYGIALGFLLATAAPGTRALAQALQVPRDYFGRQAVVVNFDTTPTGAAIPSRSLLGSTYEAWGITFGPTNYVCDWCGIVTSPPNRCTSGGLQGEGTPIECTFPQGIAAVGAYGYDFVLSVFDEDDILLGTCNYTDGTAGLFGGERELCFLGLASARPIHRARFDLYWSQQLAYGFEIDDLCFIGELPTTSVPSTWSLVKSMYR